MISGIGHNNPPPDEDYVPSKAERRIDYERARQVEIAAKQIKALFHVPLNRIMEKRKGGEDGRALRRFLIFYARGLGSPVWECAEIFDLNRKQIGQEEGEYLDMLARNPELEEDVENMTGMCDSAIKVQVGRFIRISLTEIQAASAARKAIKTAKEAANMLERRAPAQKPKRAPTEAERIQAAANAKHRADWLRSQIKIAEAVIIRGGSDGATKAERADAKREIVRLDALTAELRDLDPKKKQTGRVTSGVADPAPT